MKKLMTKAMRLFEFEPLPPDLKKEMKAIGFNVTGKALTAYIRHNYSNYDWVRMYLKMNEEETREFKLIVNDRIYKMQTLYNQLLFLRKGKKFNFSMNIVYYNKKNEKWWQDYNR